MKNIREYRSIPEANRLSIDPEDRHSFPVHASSKLYQRIKQAAEINQTSMAYIVNSVLAKHFLAEQSQAYSTKNRRAIC